jgi:hypothetical protein
MLDLASFDFDISDKPDQRRDLLWLEVIYNHWNLRMVGLCLRTR